MNKSRLITFFVLRLFFYFSVIILIPIHPGISVPFDRSGAMQWFVIIPLLAVIGFLPLAKLNLRNRCIIASAFLLPLSVLTAALASGGTFAVSVLQLFFAGFLSFALTFLLFHHPRWAKISALEPFFFAWVLLRLLALSRSGEIIAGQSMLITQFIFAWTAIVFFLHSVVVYFCLFPKSCGKNIRQGTGKEGALFAFAAIAALALVLVVLPKDFVRNTIIDNLLPDRIPQRIPEDSDWGLPMDAPGRRDARRTLPRSGENGQPSLRGLSEHFWQGRSDGASDNRQYMIKIVASDREPVYMGNSFRGQLDPVKGFLESQDEPLNWLVNHRFFVTWFNREPEFDIGRIRQEVFSLSTLPQKYLPWRPVIVDPTILSEDTGPLRYIHQIVSNTHFDDPLRLVNSPSRLLSAFEMLMLAPYLELTLEDSDLEIFTDWLNRAMENWQNNRYDIIRSDDILSQIIQVFAPVNEHLETILAILTAFSAYQYNLTFSNDHSIAVLKHFLLYSAEGDCVEFSNTLALLGRIAGIPSRVVTGFVAAESLQTIAHLRGLANLRSRIPVLQRFPFDDLFMVTNLHSHSWTQFFIPDYGWLDFEATMFAIPPVGMGDFNNWDVVIPMLDQTRVFTNVRSFPWQAVLRAVVFLAVFAAVFAYILRYGRELFLYLGTKRGGRKGARALYLLLLAKLAADGKPVKPASKTALEYVELFPDAGESFKAFAGLYTELRWREFADNAEMEQRFLLLSQEYFNIIKTTRRRGIHRCLMRIFSLRGLAYL